MRFSSAPEARRIHLGRDDTGYCWMCSSCSWKHPSPPGETDEAILQAMREYNQHQCAHYPSRHMLIAKEN